MKHFGEKIYAFATDYRKDGGVEAAVDVGFWVHELPRLIPLCRLFGHRPVVDGTDRAAWAVCDRCGARGGAPGTSDLRLDGDRVIGAPLRPQPGTFLVETPRGNVGGQLVLWKAHRGASIEFKVGNCGSEHTLAAHLHLGRLGALYLHTQKFGQGLQRRLNPTGYESRVTGISYNQEGKFLSWSLWAKRDTHSRDDPKWQYGTLNTSLLDRIWGPKRYSYEKVGEPVAGVLHLPEDDYPVNLQLERMLLGRTKRTPKLDRMVVEFSTVGAGIPTKPSGRGGVTGFAVSLPRGERSRQWANTAMSLAEAKMINDRVHYGYRPTEVSVLADTIDGEDW